jgi:hypothetical protein
LHDVSFLLIGQCWLKSDSIRPSEYGSKDLLTLPYEIVEMFSGKRPHRSFPLTDGDTTTAHPSVIKICQLAPLIAAAAVVKLEGIIPEAMLLIIHRSAVPAFRCGGRKTPVLSMDSIVYIFRIRLHPLPGCKCRIYID